jgi:orotate phosphoribosyltransferase-like protein
MALEMLDQELYSEEDVLEHVGVSKRDGAKVGSGRYRLGSGDNPYQHLEGLYGEYRKLKKQGLKDGEIAEQLHMSSGDMRGRLKYYQALKNNKRMSDAVTYLDKGYSNQQIADKLGVSTSTVANYLKAAGQVKQDKIISTRDALKDKVDKVGWVEVGDGTEAWMGIKKTLLDAAVLTLYDEGYELYSDLRVKQGGSGNYTTLKVLAKPGMTRGDVLADKGNIEATMADVKSRDGGLTYDKKGPPINISSKRIEIRYGDDEPSGTAMDGVIELRRGVPDLSMGNAQYAQVRIAVDGKYYAKGMAVYSDDLPDGVDIRVNSNKPRAKGIAGSLKPQKHVDDDPDKPIDEMNPFGTNTKEEYELERASNYYIDPKDGKKKQSALNFVNEEGGWDKWSKNLASQFLGKQPPELAKQQLNLDVLTRQREFDEIKQLTNPVLRAKLLYDFGDTCDSAAVDLQAAALPRQATATIVPANSLKENQIYAPRMKDGEEVILVRYPHGGIFEIPRLTVTHRNKEAKERIGNAATDAVCINSETAKVLSGADFDGDTVLVIPTRGHNLINKKPYDKLKEFDPHEQYAMTDEEIKNAKFKLWAKGSPREQTMMGTVSNLITDMTLQNAPDEDLIKAVKHSMVIIDVGKHKLNWKQSEIDNDIKELQKKYQPKIDPKTGKLRGGGASTLLSRAGSEAQVEAVRSYTNINQKGKPWYDPTKPEGAKIKVKDTELIPDRRKTGEVDANGRPIWETVGWKEKKRTSTKMMEADDPYTLTSGGSKENPGTKIEGIYADYATRMKAMANEARKEFLKADAETDKKNPTAAKTYKKEVDHLLYQINEAKKNAPLERRAQGLAQMKVELARQNRVMSKGEESKLLDKELKLARQIVGAERYRVHISEKEWEAIQAGAVSKTTQKELFRFTDNDRLRELAMPKTPKKLSKTFLNAAQSMLDRGYMLEEVAQRFDVSPSTLSKLLNE